MIYPFRVCGRKIEIYRYSVTYTPVALNELEEVSTEEVLTEEVVNEPEEITEYFVSREEAEQCGEVVELDTSAYEWLNGIIVPNSSNTMKEAIKIYEMGQAAYEAKQNEKKDDLKTIRADIDFLAVMTGVEL